MREIQWFPGHMKKTQRRITEELKNIDFTFELLDARIPLSSKNPDLKKLTQGKPSSDLPILLLKNLSFTNEFSVLTIIIQSPLYIIQIICQSLIFCQTKSF